MTFEELFGSAPSNYVETNPKKKDKNYVEVPPEGDKLEKFLNERTTMSPPKSNYNMFGRGFVGGDLGSRVPQNSAKEVAKPIKDEVAAVASETPKLEQSKADQIKAMFQSTPELIPEDDTVSTTAAAPGVTPQAAPTQEATYQYPTMPSYQGIDVDKIKQQAEVLAPDATGTDFALGLIPLAMDLLAGGKGAALPVGANYYTGKAAELQKRKQTLEDKLLELEKSRAVAGAKAASGGKNFQSVNIVDNTTGDVIKANFDRNTGRYYSPSGAPLNENKIRVGFSVIPEEFTRRATLNLENAKTKTDYTPRLNPETGLISRIENNALTPVGHAPLNLNPKQEKDLTQLTDKFISTDMYKRPMAALSAAANIDSLLSAANSGNATAANSARVQLARMAGDVGALSDSDIERSGGSPSVRRVIKRFHNLQSSDVPLSPMDIQEIREVARIYEYNARDKLNKSVEALDKTFVNEHGGIPGSVRSKMDVYIPDREGKSFPQIVRKEGFSATVKNRKELDEAIHGGWK